MWTQPRKKGASHILLLLECLPNSALCFEPSGKESHIIDLSTEGLHYFHECLIVYPLSLAKMSFVWFFRLVCQVCLLGHRSVVSQALEQHRVFSCVTITAALLPLSFPLSWTAWLPLQHRFALLWNQQIKWSEGASKSYDIHQMTNWHCQQSSPVSWTISTIWDTFQ